jgi:hypothetical protein
MLRERWPLAFPTKHEDVRPLAMGVAREVAVAMGWSLPYTLGVLTRWKTAAVYCEAVLCHHQRIGLDGSPAETVNAEAKAFFAVERSLSVIRSFRYDPSLPARRHDSLVGNFLARGPAAPGAVSERRPKRIGVAAPPSPQPRPPSEVSNFAQIWPLR